MKRGLIIFVLIISFSCKERNSDEIRDNSKIQETSKYEDCMTVARANGILLDINDIIENLPKDITEADMFLLLLFWEEGEVITRYTTTFIDSNKGLSGVKYLNNEKIERFFLENSKINEIDNWINSSIQHDRPYPNSLLIVSKDSGSTKCKYFRHIPLDLSKFIINPSVENFKR